MTAKRGLEKYQELLINWISSVIKPEDATNPDAYTADELELIDSVFRRLTEVTDTVDRLDLCLAFIQGPMPRRKGLKLYDYLMYHITFYIQEIYVLNERLESYAKTTMRLRKRLGLPIDKAAYESLIEMVRLSLSQIVTIRGSHVHSRAFSDERMRELSTFSFLAVHAPDRPEWKDFARDLYRISRAEWIKQLRKNRDAISRLMDEYCEFMYGQLVDVLPNNSFKGMPLRGTP